MARIKRLDLWQSYITFRGHHNDAEQLLDVVQRKLGVEETNPVWESQALGVKEKLRLFLKKCNKWYKSPAISYHTNKFVDKYKDWLNGSEEFPVICNQTGKAKSSYETSQPGSSRATGQVGSSHQTSQPGSSRATGQVGRSHQTSQPRSSCETGQVVSSHQTSQAGSSRATGQAGRPKESNFAYLSESAKRKRTKSVRESTQTEELAHATVLKLRGDGKCPASKVVKKVMEASPRTVNMIFTLVEKIKRTDSGNLDDGSPKMFSIEEAVAYQIDFDFTKDKYNLNKQKLALKNCDIFPSYDKVYQYKKKCVPKDLQISEFKASVSLQHLLDHTASRLLTVQEAIFKEGIIEGNSFELVSKIGFDGSGNQSQYNQVWKDTQTDDSTMILTAVVPLLLHQRFDSQDKINVIWMNRKPSSTVNCRPLQLEFTKETANFIKLKAQELQDGINGLEVTLVDVSGKVYEVFHKVLLTMIDGKVASAILDTGSATCNICKARPSQMNDIDLVLTRECCREAIKLGMPVLHLYIRFLEYFLNIAKRRKIVEKCYGKYTQEQKNKIEQRHKYICHRFKSELGLNLDQPTGRGGNTNTGNNARRFFDNAGKVADITGLDLDILKKTRTVLRTFACGYAINVEAFKQYCIQLARDLVHEDMYKFWCMPSAIHTALIHGADIIEALPVPIGMVSEEPLESSHKIVRYLRLHHTRKIGRLATMTDLFKALLVQTDPMIASLRRPPKPKGVLDQDVVSMLLPGNGHPVLELMDEEESDIDDPA